MTVMLEDSVCMRSCRRLHFQHMKTQAHRSPNNTSDTFINVEACVAPSHVRMRVLRLCV